MKLNWEKKKKTYHDSSFIDLNSKQTDITASVSCLASETAIRCLNDNVRYLHLDLGNMLYALIRALYLEASQGLTGGIIVLLFY